MIYKDLIYSITCLLFAIIIGAAVYEHIAVVPQWSTAPPKSLAMFQGEYGLDAESFWKMIHPVTLVLFAITLITSWRTSRRFNVLLAFTGYFVILITTAVYFVPELIQITTSAYSEQIDSELTQRANNWELLSLIRLVALIALSIVLFLGLTKTEIVEKNKI